MSSSHPARWIAFFLSAALIAFGCTTSTHSPHAETGDLALELVIADGVVIDEVNWRITGNGMDMSGVIDVSAPGATASVEVFGLPPGDENYTITLSAESIDEQVTCRGSAEFNVQVGEVTDVMVVLNCKLPERFGAVRANGKFNICAELLKAVVAPLQTSVGRDIDLNAQAVDKDEDPITFSWTANSGSIDDPSAPVTTYTCQAVGDDEITISVTDNDEYCDMANWTIPVTCVEGDGVECNEDSDCDQGEICVENECVPDVECNENSDCDQGEICVENECVPDVECNEDDDCGVDEVCFNNECRSDPDVFCDEGICVTDTEARLDCIDAFFTCLAAEPVDEEDCIALALLQCNECNENTDCDEGEICDEFVCVPAPECVESADCADDNECTADVCVDGTCSNPNVDPGEPCEQDGVCDGSGACVECVGTEQCPPAGQCNAAVCVDNACGSEPAREGLECDLLELGDGICESGECVEPPECISPGDCIDGNPCTMGDCVDGMCQFIPVQGGSCDSGTGSGDGTCDNTGMCVSNDECAENADCPDDDGNECTLPVCDTSGAPYVCDEDAEAANGNECNSGAGTCQDGDCAEPLATCDPTGSGEVVPCTTRDLLAIDCFLLGSGAPIPLDPVIEPSEVAFAGIPLDVTPTLTLNLPASLVCGFATVVPAATVYNSLANLDVDGAAPTSIGLNSFLGDPPTSPHAGIDFNFKEGCGDAPGTCVGGTCATDGTTSCETDVDCQETGPGVVVPLVAGSPTSSPGSETLTPSGSGAILFSYGFDDIGAVIRVPALFANLCIGQIAEDNGPPTPPGGFCGFTCVPADRTGDGQTGAPNDAPRIMYDAECNKVGALAGDCEPFFDFSGAANVCATGQPGSALAETEAPCNGENSSSLRGEDCEGRTTCGNCQQVTGPAPLNIFNPQQDWPIVEFCSSIPGNANGRCAGTNGFIQCPNGDSDCRNQDGSGKGSAGEDYCIVPCDNCDQQDCCNWIQSRYPNATPTQFPALPINPAP